MVLIWRRAIETHSSLIMRYWYANDAMQKAFRRIVMYPGKTLLVPSKSVGALEQPEVRSGLPAHHGHHHQTLFIPAAVQGSCLALTWRFPVGLLVLLGDAPLFEIPQYVC